MATLTIRLPDDTHERLRHLAQHRGMSLNKLFEGFSVASLADFDAETRFRLLAAQGDPKKGIAVLNKLDEKFRTKSRE